MNVSAHSPTAGLARARRSYLENQRPVRTARLALPPPAEDRGARDLSAVWLGFVIGVAFAAAVVALVGMVAS